MVKLSRKKFGLYIQQVREEKGLSRAELAGKLFVTEAAVWKWEKGKRYPDFETLGNLAAELGISTQDIYDNSHEETSINVMDIIGMVLIIALLVGAVVFGVLHIRHGKEPSPIVGDENALTGVALRISEQNGGIVSETIQGTRLIVDLQGEGPTYIDSSVEGADEVGTGDTVRVIVNDQLMIEEAFPARVVSGIVRIEVVKKGSLKDAQEMIRQLVEVGVLKQDVGNILPSGLRIKSTGIEQGNGDARYTYLEYDEQGRQIKTTHQKNKSGEKPQKDIYTYIYDEDSDYTYTQYGSVNGEATRKLRSVKVENGRVCRETEFNEDETLITDTLTEWLPTDTMPLYFRLIESHFKPLTHVKRKVNGQTKNEYGFLRNERGRIVKYRSEDGEGRDIVYIYDEQDRLSAFGQTEIVYSQDGFMVVDASGDEKQKLYEVVIGEDRTELKGYDMDGRVWFREEYDKDYQCLSTEQYDAEGTIRFSMYNTWDENGEIIKQEGVSEDGSPYQSSVIYEKGDHEPVTLKQTRTEMRGMLTIDVEQYCEGIPFALTYEDVRDVEYGEDGLVKSFRGAGDEAEVYTIAYRNIDIME